MEDNIVSKSIKGILNFGFKIVSLWFKIWLLPINSVFEWILERVKPVLDPLFSFFNTHKAKLLKYSLLSIFYLIFLLFVTTLSYYAIYSTLVPKVSTEEPLFFDYSFKSTKKIVADVQASVEFQKSKHYNIYLELELPESPKNQEIGMFMACMDIDDHDKWNPQKIHHTCRPAILKYTSSLLKSMKNVLYAIPYLFGIYEEKQIIVLPMGENFIANRFYQTISASIQINNPEIQIYRASLKFLANLNGFDYYLYYYPILSFIIGCSIIYTSLLFASVFVVASLYLYRHFNGGSGVGVEELEEYEDGGVGVGSYNDDNVSVPDNEDILVGDEGSDVESYVNNNDAIPIISIPRRNGATSTISTQKRKPIWDQINDTGDNNIASSSSSGNIIGGSLSFSNSNNKGEDSLGLFTSPKVTPIQKSRQSSSYENSQFYKDLDEAFSQSVSKSTTTDSYSWDIDNNNNDNNNNKQSTSSPLIRSVNNNNYNAINNNSSGINIGKTPSSPPPPMVKNNNHNNNNDDDLLESPRSMDPHLILSTSTTTTQPLDQEQTLTSMIINLATDNNHQPQQSPIPTQQPLQLDNNNNDNDDKEEKDNEQSEQDEETTSFKTTTTTTTQICESDSNNSISSTEESDNEETADSEGSDDNKVEEAGNSGYASEEWVKIKDSSVRKRKN